jgi:hypothetical protein
MKKITTFLLAVIISLSACNTEKRAVKRLARLKTEQPTLVASFCGEMFPIKTETKHTIEYREGKTDTIWQNEYIDCDTVIGETRVVKVPYPVQIRTKDTIVMKTIEVQENTAKNEAYERRAIQAEERAKHYKKRATRNAFWGVISGMLLTIVSQFIIKR